MSQWEKSRHLPSSCPLPPCSTYRKIERGVVARWLVPSLTRTTNPTKAGGPQWFLLDFTGCLRLQVSIFQIICFLVEMGGISAIDWLIRNDFVKMICKNIVISLMIFSSHNWSSYFQYLHLWSDYTEVEKLIFFQVSFFMAILKRAPCIYARQSWRAAEAVVSSSQCVADKWIKFPGNHRFGQQFGHFYCSKNPLFSVERQLLSM